MTPYERNLLDRITGKLDQIAQQLHRLADAAERAHPTPEQQDQDFASGRFIETQAAFTDAGAGAEPPDPDNHPGWEWNG